jgi:hypothetical protein
MVVALKYEDESDYRYLVPERKSRFLKNISIKTM